MKCLYFDCFCGISGDMTLGALIDLGLPARYLRDELKKLKVPGYTLRVSRAARMGISGRTVSVKTDGGKKHHHHRTLRHIKSIISKSRLGSTVKERSLDIFQRIAEAEARIHNRKASEIHFHEVGALDSIVDIVGCAIGMDYLGVGKSFASTVPLGSGFVKCQHGTLPVPAPATLLLLKGVPVYDSGIRAELVTPTGAAILTSFSEGFGPLPAMRILRTGYGAGRREHESLPNMLRLILGEAAAAVGGDRVWLLEANIDDMNPEWAGFAMERLFDAGALDVSLIPLYMKKNRPGTLIQIVCSRETKEALTRTLFEETTTAGVRAYPAERSVLKRRPGTIQTKYGRLKVKILEDSRGPRVVPEFEECRKAALKKKVPLRDVYEEVIAAAHAKAKKR